MDKKKYQKKWRQENKERFNNCKKVWNEKNKEKVKKIRKDWKERNHKEQRKLDNVRQNTRRKYGSLKQGFSYHHPKPYNKDHFTILEDKFHRFYHQVIEKNCRGMINWRA